MCCRSQACVGSALPPYKVGNLNSKLFLSEISKREKSLKRTLEGRTSDVRTHFPFNPSLTSRPSLSSPHPSIDLPAVHPGVPQRSELRLWSGETETFHCLPRGERERREKRRPGVQGLFLVFVLAVEAALPGLHLRLWRRSVHQPAAPGALRPASHRRGGGGGGREQLPGQPPLGLRVRVLALPPRGQRLLPLLPAGRAASVRGP